VNIRQTSVAPSSPRLACFGQSLRHQILDFPKYPRLAFLPLESVGARVVRPDHPASRLSGCWNYARAGVLSILMNVLPS